jgi:asparagine synthetase B (glutamine-hydrolysing)
MCGIFGMISKKSKRFNKRAFFTMGVRNDSRGGDSCGVFIDKQVEYGVDKKKCSLVFSEILFFLKKLMNVKLH